MAPDEVEFLAHTELAHHVSGEVVRYNLRRPGERFHLATRGRNPDLLALVSGIIGPDERRLILTVVECRNPPEEAAAQAVTWLNE